MVLAANNGRFAYMVPKFSLGCLCDPQDPELLAQTFDRALIEAEGYKLSAAAKRLVEFHRLENFVLQWRRELCRIMSKCFSTRLELGLEWITVRKALEPVKIGEIDGR
jgi:hypothetical protein